MLKKCKSCEEVHPLSEFGTYKGMPLPTCNSCMQDFNASITPKTKEIKTKRLQKERGFFKKLNRNETRLHTLPYTRLVGDFSYEGTLCDLKGSPAIVTGNFDCSNKRVVSLTGAPFRVEGSFLCSENKLLSLMGSPKYVGGTFDCHNNRLVGLKSLPKYVGGDLIIPKHLLNIVGLDDIWDEPLIKRFCKVGENILYK